MDTKFEKVIVVTPKHTAPDFIYQNGHILKKPSTPALPNLTYHYGYLYDRSDSESGVYDRIIVTTRRLSQGQILSCKLSDDFCSMHDAQYGQTITYPLTYDSGNYQSPSDKTLNRSRTALLSTRKNLRRYFDMIRHNQRFSQLHLSWHIPRY